MSEAKSFTNGVLVAVLAMGCFVLSISCAGGLGYAYLQFSKTYKGILAPSGPGVPTGAHVFAPSGHDS